MNICDAVSKALIEGGFIEREAFDNGKLIRELRIKPTNSSATCIIYTLDEKGHQINGCKNWNPTAEDLMAEDWRVVKE